MEKAIHVLLADDHKILLDGMTQLINSMDNIEVKGTASNGKQVLEFLKENKVDIVLMDIDMPILNGIETCKIISDKFPDVKVMALSMYQQYSYVNRMIKNGAKAYLLKTSGKEEIDKAIQIVQNGEQYISPSVQKVIFEGMSNNSEKKQGYVPPITKREKEILKLIADEFTNKEVAEKLFISVSTVEFHRKNLLEKFNARNSVGLVKSAIEKGLI